MVFFGSISSAVENKGFKGHPPKPAHDFSGVSSTCSSQHFFSFTILQCKCDRPNTGHPWVLVMWEWGWELFEASLGTILWNKQLIVLRVKTWVLQNVQIMIEIWFWYQCAWCLSCPNLLCSKKSGLRRKCGSPRSPHRAPVHYQLHPSGRMPSGNSRLVSEQDSRLTTVPVLLLQLLLNETNELKKSSLIIPSSSRSFSLTGMFTRLIQISR